jgi:hypothetical protein
MTIAERVAARFHDDGMVWKDDSGHRLEDVLRAEGGSAEYRDGRGIAGGAERWTLPDGSIITIAGDAWDFGYPDCFCWASHGHNPEGCARADSDND